jgi:integrase
MGKLTVAGIKALRHDGTKPRPIRFGDGDGLYLQIAKGNSKQWLFRFTMEGREREMGLGTVALSDADAEAGALTLAGARTAAREAASLVKDGVDPIEARKAAREAEIKARHAAKAATFEAAARAHVAERASGWRNEKHGAQWLTTLEAHAFPVIGARPIAHIGTDDVLRVLRPIWDRIPETASRVRQRIEAILESARVKGLRAEHVANPARWKGHLSEVLPAPGKVKGKRHMPALPWEEMAGFWKALEKHQGMGGLALQFSILTASRTGAVRLMRWREIDLEAAIWTAPRENMKAGKAHRSPLPPAALAILQRVKPLALSRDDLVFPSKNRRGEGAPLSDMALSELIRGMSFDDLAPHEPPRWRDREGRPIVPHGFRSTFKGWALAAGFADDLSEIALAHADKDKTRAAYAREDRLEQRREMMAAWASHCIREPSAPVSLAEERLKRAR